MSDNNLYSGSCEVVNALNLLSGRWKLPILWKLSYGNIRYNELKRQVHGITNIMLTRSLQELEAHGLVSRIQYSEIPPHVEYCLTKSGQKLVPALHELKKWGEEQAIVERQLHSTSNNKE
jgi:DNA-binding HxlR family transcriptional regulator